MEKYVFRKYEANYKKFFSVEKRKLRKALGAKALIEHVGSTAIPRLGGKGIVDILLAVPRNEISKTSKTLQKLVTSLGLSQAQNKDFFSGETTKSLVVLGESIFTLRLQKAETRKK